MTLVFRTERGASRHAGAYDAFTRRAPGALGGRNAASGRKL